MEDSEIVVEVMVGGGPGVEKPESDFQHRCMLQKSTFNDTLYLVLLYLICSVGKTINSSRVELTSPLLLQSLFANRFQILLYFVFDRL